MRRLGPLALVTAAFAIVAASLPAHRPTSAAAPAHAYRVTYLITDSADPDETTLSHERIEIRRPYDGRLTNSAGRVTNREFQWQLDEKGKPRFGFRRAPGGAVRDVSFTALRDAARAGVIDRAGNGTWLHRRCVWFVAYEPPPARLKAPARDGRLEMCVDPAGIVLREVWMIDGRVVRSVEAERVELNAKGADFLEKLDPEKDELSGDNVEEMLRSQSVVADEVPTPHVPFDLETPKGWTLDRRSVVVENVAGASTPGQFASNAFVRDDELVVVEVALREGDEATWALDEGDPIDVGFGTGRILWFADRVELRVVVKEGFVRVFAPSLSVARTFASALQVR